jgi:hypothetical protein
MRGRCFAVALLALPFVTALACADEEPGPGSGELPSTAVEGITGSCTALTIGMVCDPDGTGTAAQECQGTCQLNTSGAPTCVRLAQPSTVDGAACGGTGSDCTRSCSGGVCTNTPAAVLAACRPANATANACSGVCAGPVSNRQCFNIADFAPQAGAVPLRAYRWRIGLPVSGLWHSQRVRLHHDGPRGRDELQRRQRLHDRRRVQGIDL